MPCLPAHTRAFAELQKQLANGQHSSTTDVRRISRDDGTGMRQRRILTSSEERTEHRSGELAGK